MAIGITMTAESEPAQVERDILGVRIADLTRGEAFELLRRAIATRRHVKVAFCNAHTANTAHEDANLCAALTRFLVLSDGLGVDIAAKLLFGVPFKANLNGTDFVPELLATSPHQLSIAMIGGRPGIAERAAVNLAGLGPGHRIGPVLCGFATPEEQARFLSQLAMQPVDVILVAMGNPRQELFIDTRINSTHAAVALGVGALFDFSAGEVRRAPLLVRRLRLEWIWRLLLEPRRLFRRYVLGNPLFLARVALARLRRGLRP